MNILVFCPNWVGDAVMATPALRSIRRGFPEARIWGVGRPAIAEVLEGLPFLDGWQSWDPRGAEAGQRTLPVLRALRQLHPEAAVVFPNSFRAALAARLSGARKRVGYRRGGRGWLFTEALEPLRSRGRFVPTPAVDSYLKLACALGCPEESRRLELATPPASEEAAAALWRAFGFLDASRVVVLNPGAAYGKAKLWPAAHFVELARRLLALPGTGVLVLSGPAERELARGIVRAVDRPGLKSLADQPVSINLSKACVRRSQLLITTDSGPRHFAAAFGVPVVTLFGPTHIEWSETFYERAVHLQKKVPCGPCQLRECPLDHRCMRELLPEEVFRAASELLERFGRERAAAQ
jgi:heptosyltransferase-2